MSDHCLILIRRSTSKIKLPQKIINTRSFKNFDEQAFLEDLGNTDWHNVINASNIDDATTAFNDNITSVLNNHAPYVRKRVKQYSPPWFNEDLSRSIKERDYLKKVASRTRLDKDWSIFKAKRNFVSNLKSQLKREYYQNTLLQNKQNPKRLWKTLSNIIPNDTQTNNSPKTITRDGIEISEKKEIAEVFNNFFASIGSQLASAFNFSDTFHICPVINKSTFHFSQIPLSTVQKTISTLDNSKATGLDRIGVRVLKSGSPIISFYLTHIFNLSLRTGCVPKCWKKKRVTPVFKKGDTDDVNNYRPISIIPIAMKIFEKIVHSQVSTFLDATNILQSSQSGFRNKHSTDTAVLCVSDFILEELGKGRYVGAVLIDLKKAFDTVDHRILLKKLFCYGIRDAPFEWFESYLKDRVQCTVVDDTHSSFITEDSYGVPQGSVLGPLLFLLYINDIFSSIDTKVTFCHLYADDTIIIQSSNCPMSLKTGLEHQLKNIGIWFHQNKLSVNTSKTEVIYFGRPKKVEECKTLPPIVFQESNIDCKNKVKYLGILFDEGMSWKNQSNQARKKAFHSLHKIKKILTFIDKDTTRLLLNALVFPHINYCLNTWSSTSSTNIKKFDALFKQADKLFPVKRSFSQLVNYSKAVMVFKGLNNLSPPYISNRLKLVSNRHTYNTRSSAQNNIVQTTALTKYSSRTFLKTSTSVWNNLPAKLKLTESLLSFKSLAKKHFLTNM